MTNPAPDPLPETASIAPPAAASLLALAARLDTDAAPKLREDLLGLRGQNVELDASSVTRLGGLCATVLASAAQSWAGDGHGLAIRAPSESFTAGLERLGLTLDQLECGGAA
ncbi:MAG: chemotaxis protein CheX [Rhodobacterales bacterium]|nr:MAG: chemotaxis protein CheX [Rhodobacterales bacterium]